MIGQGVKTLYGKLAQLALSNNLLRFVFSLPEKDISNVVVHR